LLGELGPGPNSHGCITAYSHFEIVEKELRVEQTGTAALHQGQSITKMSSNGRLEAEVIVNVSTSFEMTKIINDLIKLWKRIIVCRWLCILEIQDGGGISSRRIP